MRVVYLTTPVIGRAIDSSVVLVVLLRLNDVEEEFGKIALVIDDASFRHYIHVFSQNHESVLQREGRLLIDHLVKSVGHDRDEHVEDGDL